MVGGRSAGCRTCKNRKIKCDERRPTCVQCERSRRKCTGVLPLFVLHPKKSEVLASRAPAGRRTVPSESSVAIESLLVKSYNLPQLISTSDSEKLAWSLCRVVDSPRMPGLSLIFLGAYYYDIPRRIGHSSALDAAVACIVYGYEALYDLGHAERAIQIRKYVKALHAIRSELESPTGSSSETLCAAIVLCGFEIMFYDQKSPGWVTHSEGVAALFRARGPQNLTSFERSMLRGQMGSISMTSMIYGSKSLFHEPVWQSLLLDEGSSNIIDRFNGRVQALNACFPEVIQNAHSSLADQEQDNRIREKTWDFKLKLEETQTEVEFFLASPQYIWQTPSESPDAPFPTSYQYHSMLLADDLCFYWRFVLSTNRILSKLGVDSKELRQESIDAAEHICKSVEYAQKWKPFGSIGVLMGLGIARYTLIEEDQKWVERMIEELSTPSTIASEVIFPRYLEIYR